jgi:large subunit ribosomal protein L3
MVGLVGRKVGMTRIFDENGRSVPITLILIEEHRVVAVRTTGKDGYQAVQVTCGRSAPQRLTKAVRGVYAKAELEPGRGLWEFRLSHDDVLPQIGQSYDISLLEHVERVHVTGVTIGKGYAGAVKRHGFRTQDATHGNSLSHRAPGSIGQRQTPGRVFKGKKMSGHLGNVQCTVQNLDLVWRDKERGLLAIRGSVPGYDGADVLIRAA